VKLPPSPFKGLAYFGDSEHDWRFFFGRERESEVVAANLMASRLTVLYGPSGVGKSSLLRAGVVRRLRTLVPAGPAADEPTEVVIVDGWRDDPVLAVATAAEAATDISLADALAERAIATGAEIYLILDQMEEYVLYHGRDGGPLAGALEDVLTRPDLAVHVLLGVRDDSLADLDSLKRRVPGLFGNVLRLDHLTRAAARSAIEGPLRAYAELGGPELTAEDELVEAVLEEVAAGRIEQQLSGRGLVDEGRRERRVEAPYLQLVLERLWDVERQRGSDVLRASTLVELGRAERIVEEHLERALEGLDADERDLVARLFNHLVTPSGTKIAHGVDDLARYANEEPALLEPLLSSLDAARILRRVPGKGGEGSRYEIFHDVLAPAVQAWRTRHEAEQALAGERAAARSRHRRIAVVAVVALVALAGMTALAAWALSQRAEAREQALAADAGASFAKARELEANAIVQLGRDPELGLLLATRAARLAPAATTEDVLRRTLRASRVRTVAQLGSPVSDLVVLGDGTTLAAVTGRGGVRLVEGGKPSRVVVAPRGGSETWFSGDLALTARAGVLTVRRLPLGSVIAAVPVPSAIRFAAAGPDLRLIVAGERGARVVGLDGRLLVSLPHPARVRRAEFSPNGELIATAGADGDAIVWNARGTRLRTLTGGTNERNAGQVLDVSFSHLSRLVATASTDGTARVWDVLRGTRVSIMPLHGHHVRRARFGANEDSLLTASRDGTARTWKVETGGPRAVFAGHFDAVTAAVFMPGDRLATASDDGTVRIWVAQLQPPLVPARFTPAPRPGHDARATLKGAVVALRIHGRELTLRGHRDDVSSVEVSRDGSRVVTASVDGDVRIWDARTGKSMTALVGHVGTVFDASFSPNGRWVVTGGPTAAGLWDATTGERIYFLQGHGGPVRAAAFTSPTRIVTSGADGVRAYLCDICGGLKRLLSLAERRLARTGRTLSPTDRLRYLGQR
jgi:WD40 repeat protein